MNFRARRAAGRDEPSIDLMPLIDVVFLLLIFFMITTSFNREDQSAIPVNLPSGVSGESTQSDERVVLVITPNGDAQIESELAIPDGTLDERLEWLHQNKPDALILLKGDSEAAHGRVVEILDLLKSRGFQKVNLVIKRR